MVNVAFLILLGVYIALETLHETEERNSNMVHSIFSAVVFILLIVTLVFHCWKLKNTTMDEMRAVKSHTKSQLVTVCLFIAFLFATRCVVDLMDAVGTRGIDVGFSYGTSFTVCNS